MPTIEQQLNELVKQKNALATALRDKGVEAEDNETLNSLVGKVSQTVSSEEIEALQQQVATLTQQNKVLSEENAKLILQNKKYIEPVDNYNELTGTFNLVNAVKSVDVPNGVTKLYGYQTTREKVGCFYGAECLKCVILPVSLSEICSVALGNCLNLEKICYRGTQQQWNAITKGDNWNLNMGSNVTGGTQIIYNYTG